MNMQAFWLKSTDQTKQALKDKLVLVFAISGVDEQQAAHSMSEFSAFIDSWYDDGKLRKIERNPERENQYMALFSFSKIQGKTTVQKQEVFGYVRQFIKYYQADPQNWKSNLYAAWKRRANRSVNKFMKAICA